MGPPSALSKPSKISNGGAEALMLWPSQEKHRGNLKPASTCGCLQLTLLLFPSLHCLLDGIRTKKALRNNRSCIKHEITPSLNQNAFSAILVRLRVYSRRSLTYDLRCGHFWHGRKKHIVSVKSPQRYETKFVA